MPNLESFPIGNQWTYNITVDMTNLNTTFKTDISYAASISRGDINDYLNNPTKIIVEFEPNTPIYTPFMLDIKIVFKYRDQPKNIQTYKEFLQINIVQMDIKVYESPLAGDKIVPLLATTNSGCNETTAVPTYDKEIKAVGIN